MRLESKFDIRIEVRKQSVAKDIIDSNFRSIDFELVENIEEVLDCFEIGGSFVLSQHLKKHLTVIDG